jgi:predicted ArsR family transcriptional regulator
MSHDEFADRVADVAVLADPIRRDLYQYVAGQPSPVSRDDASEALSVPRHTVKFHLDKLVQQGLLSTTFQRLTGRTGPGAGRPTKLYRRSGREVSVTLPERRYDLAGQLMAQAIDESAANGPVLAALHAAAGVYGKTMGEAALGGIAQGAALPARVIAGCDALAARGYEPRADEEPVTLANCPFDALARTHVELVCGMNLALLEGFADGVGTGTLTARLHPADGRCCVVLDTGR